MDSVLRGSPFLFIYLYDILVAGASAKELLSHLCQLFKGLSNHGLIVKPAKCQFGLPVIGLLGHHFSPQRAVPPAHLMSPLYEALRGKRANADVDWTPQRIQAFEDTKAALAMRAVRSCPSGSHF